MTMKRLNCKRLNIDYEQNRVVYFQEEDNLELDVI